MVLAAKALLYSDVFMPLIRVCQHLVNIGLIQCTKRYSVFLFCWCEITALYIYYTWSPIDFSASVSVNFQYIIREES
jgi:hypothetical protein